MSTVPPVACGLGEAGGRDAEGVACGVDPAGAGWVTEGRAATGRGADTAGAEERAAGWPACLASWASRASARFTAAAVSC